MTAKLAVLSPDVIIPNKVESGACYDLFPHFDEDEFVFDVHETKLVPTGIISAFPDTHQVFFHERGFNTKSKLKISAGVIEGSYRGEWFVALYNTTHDKIIIRKNIGDNIIYGYREIIVPYSRAICQFKFARVEDDKMEVVSADEILAIVSARGDGALGNSGN